MKKFDKEVLDAYKAKLDMIRNGAAANPWETATEKAARITFLKSNVAAAVEYYFKEYASAECADFQLKLAAMVKTNPTLKALVRWGRGLAKSVWCDLIIPFWLWMNDEIFYMVVVGNNYDKGCILLSDLQAEFEANPRIIHDFGPQITKGDWTKGYFRTKNGFVAKALGMGQSPRGLRLRSRRPDYIVCDDLEDRETAKNPKRQKEIVKWIEQDLLPTMDGPRRRYLHPNNDFAPVTIQNILEKRHITGKKKPKWWLQRVNSYDPVTYKPAWASKYTPEYYQEVEEELGTIAANAEYNNDGVIEGDVFTSDMIQWDKRPDLDHFDVLAGVWDVAFSGKNDYNAVPVWGLKGRDLWKVKQFCKQCDMRDAIAFMYEYQEKAERVGATVVWMVEKQFWDKPVQDALDDMEEEYGYALNITVVDRSRMDKYIRILTMHPLYQRKRIKYADSERYDNDMVVANAQLFGIEPGYTSHDDAPDADEMTVHELQTIMRVERADKTRVTSRKKIMRLQKNRY